MHESDAQAVPKRSWAAIKPFYAKIVISGILLAAAFWILYAAGGGENMTFQQVRRSAADLKEQVNANYLLSVLVFILGYIALAIWLPAAAVLTLLGGFLFGTLLNILYVLCAAVAAAVITFWLNRYLLGQWVQRKWERSLEGFNQNLHSFGTEYLIMIRLIPMMPFVVINALAGMTKVPTLTFAWTTALGVLPGIVIFSYLGRSLPQIRSVDDLWSWKIIAILVLMRIVLLITVLMRLTVLKKKGFTGLTAVAPADRNWAYVD